MKEVENEILDEKKYQKVKKIFNKSSDYFTKKEIEEIFSILNYIKRRINLTTFLTTFLMKTTNKTNKINMKIKVEKP